MVSEKAGHDSEDAESWERDRQERMDQAIAQMREFFTREEYETRRQRERFAKKCGTTWGNLQQILQKQRSIPVWLAINLDRESGGVLNMTELHTEVDARHGIDWEYVRKAMRRKQPKV